MFTIKLEDVGRHPEYVLSAIKNCLRLSFKTPPEILDKTRDSIAEKLKKPDVMGPLFRYLWVDEMGRNYFIIIATSLEDGKGRGKPILGWAVRKKMRRLTELSLEVIGESLKEIEDIDKLGLPTLMEEDIAEVFKNLSL